MIPHSFILADLFDVISHSQTPAHLYDQEAFTAPSLEPDYYQPTERDWIAPRRRYNVKTVLIYRYSQISDENKTIWERKHEALLRAA